MKIEIIKNSKTIELINKLLTELDDLYEELEYDNDSDEVITINSKINIRVKLLENLMKL